MKVYDNTSYEEDYFILIQKLGLDIIHITINVTDIVMTVSEITILEKY